MESKTEPSEPSEAPTPDKYVIKNKYFDSICYHWSEWNEKYPGTIVDPRISAAGDVSILDFFQEKFPKLYTVEDLHNWVMYLSMRKNFTKRTDAGTFNGTLGEYYTAYGNDLDLKTAYNMMVHMTKLGGDDWRALCTQEIWVYIAKAADPRVTSLNGGEEYYFLNLSKFVWEPGFTLGDVVYDANHWMTVDFHPGAANLTTIEHQQGSGPAIVRIFGVLSRYDDYLKDSGYPKLYDDPGDAPAQPGSTSPNELKLRF